MQASCQCGKLTATIDDGAEPMVVMCHCLDCQRRSGSHYGSIAYYPAEAVAIDGEANEFVRGSDSGNTFATGFCPACGSTVYALPGRMPELIGVTVGTIAEPAFPAPIRSVYEQSRHRWLAMPEAMPGYARGRDEEPIR
jgi:hypothetical protein